MRTDCCCWSLFGTLILVSMSIDGAEAQKPIAFASNPLMNVDLAPTTELKAMLLHNLNKHSDGEETLEALGSHSKSLGVPKYSAATALPPTALDVFKPTNLGETPVGASADELPFNVIQNFFNDEESPLTKSSSGPPRAPQTPLLGFGDLLRPLSGFSLPTLPPFQQLATLPPLPTLPSLITLPPPNFDQDIHRQQRFSIKPPTTTTRSTLSRKINGPRFVNQSSAYIPPEHVQMWRRRFYKVFKEIKNQHRKTIDTDSDENTSSNSHKHEGGGQFIRKPVEEDAMSRAQKVGGRDHHFLLEHSGYSYKGENGRRAGGSKEAVFAGSGNSKQKPNQDRTALLSEFSPSYRGTTTQRPVRVHVSNDYEEEQAEDLAPQVDDDTNLEEEPCQAVGCSGHLWNPPQRDDDTRETCNSIRLKVLIENSIIGADAEQSKRIIQTRTEAEFGTFFNVICGSGFFSYIAHTDEFCLASKDDMNCYVFSPVCAESLGIANGFLHRNKRLLNLRRKALNATLKKKAYINRN